MKKFLILNNNHTCPLPLSNEYNFQIIKACFNFSGTILQLMISLESLDGIYHDVILQEIELNSPEFEYFKSILYAIEEKEVIDFDLEAITLISGIAKIASDTKNSKVRIIWESVETFQTLLSSAEEYRVESDCIYTNEHTQKLKELLSENEDCVDSTNETSEFMILSNRHVCTLPIILEYHFHIIKACFSPKGDYLQMMILLTNKEHNFKDVVYEEIPLNSSDFNNFVNISYAGEARTVIDFCPDRLLDCWGTVILKQTENNVCVDWKNAESDSTPLSSVGMLKLDWQ